MEVIWYTAMSMDGRIAAEGHSLDFLETIKGEPGSEGGFSDFLTGVDAIVIGASTFRWLLEGGHGWPHDNLPTWLISHDEALGGRVGSTTQPLRTKAGDLGAVFDEIEEMGHQRVWLSGGGNIAGQALAVDRVSEVRVTIAPTVLGAGPALFEGKDLPMRRFHLTECRMNGNTIEAAWVRERK